MTTSAASTQRDHAVPDHGRAGLGSLLIEGPGAAGGANFNQVFPLVPTATNINPKVGAGNNSIPRLQWAYGTLGPWLIGQYNSAWADPLLFAPDIGDQNQIGPLQTVNIRRPQIRYTYLAGNGISLSGSLESMATGAVYCQAAGTTTCIGTSTAAAAALASTGSTNADVANGGLVNLPSFNTGIAWDQPWGHVMGRVGVGRSDDP